MHEVWKMVILGQEVHIGTLLMIWAAIVAVVWFLSLTTKNLSVKPGFAQWIAEKLYDLCRSITMATAGPRGDAFLFFVGSIFIFIMVCNIMGQLPLGLLGFLPITNPDGHHAAIIAATGDINTPMALALCTLITYFVFGISKKGLGYFKHYLSPNPFFLPINLLEDFTRPGSLMIRLYFNILVGEILTMIALSAMPFVLPVFVIFLELFVAIVQAFIFAVLSSVYISLLSEDHDHHEEHHASEGGAHHGEGATAEAEAAA